MSVVAPDLTSVQLEWSSFGWSARLKELEPFYTSLDGDVGLALCVLATRTAMRGLIGVLECGVECSLVDQLMQAGAPVTRQLVDPSESLPPDKGGGTRAVLTHQTEESWRKSRQRSRR